MRNSARTEARLRQKEHIKGMRKKLKKLNDLLGMMENDKFFPSQVPSLLSIHLQPIMDDAYWMIWFSGIELASMRVVPPSERKEKTK